MDSVDTFKESEYSENWTIPIKALWHIAQDAWDKAHFLVQDDNSSESAWRHAHLHRKEGNEWNAEYWYNRAGKTKPDLSIGDEYVGIVRELLGK